MKPNDFSQLNVLADTDFSRRSQVREERHPNSVTAPPVNRGSMTPRPWRGFWNSLGTAALVKLGAGRDAEAGAHPVNETKQPWQRAAARRRFAFMMLTLLSTVIASSLFASVQPDYDNLWLEYGQIGLYGLLSGWVVTGFVTALMGFYVSVRGDKHSLSAKQVANHPMNPEARTAIIMPICNEDVATVFAGLRATCESVAATGHARQFDVFVLSDSYNPETAAAERAAWEDLRAALAESPNQPQVEVYYRLRTRRTHRKAGNVADFCRRWGKDYRYMVVLDADSVMSGDCLTSMVKLMEANPTAGIIQTATQAIGHVTLHARAQQFASRVTGRLFTLGMQFWQLGESHYWGHNAIIRIKPFMEHCGLAPLPGKGPLSGEILSHDFVEAAMMRRAGWGVWIAYDLPGSFEELPPNLLDEVKRDRRWCQGNLMNFRLWMKQGFHAVHRAVFLTGIMAYVSAPLWFLFLMLSTAALAKHALVPPEYFTKPYQLFPTWPEWHPEKALALFSATATLLFLPKLASVILLLKDAKQYGGVVRLFLSMLIEMALSALLAPTRMLFHTKFVIAAYSGWGISWKSPPREDAETTWGEAFRRHGWHTALGLVWGAGVYYLSPGFIWWLLPIVGSLALSIPLSVMLSRVSLGRAARRAGLFMIPEETNMPREIVETQQHVEAAQETPGFADAVVDPVTNALMCATATARKVMPEPARLQHASLVQHALTHGPNSLSPAQKHVLLGDPFALSKLHELVWGSPLADAAWKETRVLMRRAPNVLPLRPRPA